MINPADIGVLPPALLRYKVAGTDNAEWFTNSGRMSLGDLSRALAAIGQTIEDFNDILEWGCGCGRILRHLPPPVAPNRLYGVDIDEDALRWVNENLPWVETNHTTGLPPLSYADNSFDLIFNHSVMTHLDENYQDAWLAELRRILRPGGILTLTISGRHSFKAFLDSSPQDAPYRANYTEPFSGKGILYIAQDNWTEHFPDFYHSTFHNVHYIFNHWATFLNVRCYIVTGALDYQDMVVLQKPL